jgi:Protein of unknown function (DUF3137)
MTTLMTSLMTLPHNMNPKRTSSQRPRTGRPGLFKRLQPEVQRLEQDRLRVQRRTLMFSLGIAVFAAILVGIGWILNTTIFVYATLIALALLAIRGVQLKAQTAPSQSKHQVMGRFARALGSTFQVINTGGINETDLTQSRLFHETLTSFRSEHHLRGKVGSAKLELSEVHAEFHTRQRSIPAVFAGLWIVAEFPASFRTNTLIQPVSDKLESAQEGLRTVKLEDANFTQVFDVSSEDSVEAQYVLSTKFLNRLREFHEVSGREVHLALQDRRLHIALTHPASAHPGAAQSDLSGPEFAQSLLEALDLSIGVLRELEANPYIWNRALSEPRSVGPEVLEFALKTTQERNPVVGPRYRKPDFQGPEPQDFGQRDFGQRDFGQRDFGQRDFGQQEIDQQEIGQQDFTSEIQFENPVIKRRKPATLETQQPESKSLNLASESRQ